MFEKNDSAAKAVMICNERHEKRMQNLSTEAKLCFALARWRSIACSITPMGEVGGLCAIFYP